MNLQRAHLRWKVVHSHCDALATGNRDHPHHGLHHVDPQGAGRVAWRLDGHAALNHAHGLTLSAQEFDLLADLHGQLTRIKFHARNYGEAQRVRQ